MNRLTWILGIFVSLIVVIVSWNFADKDFLNLTQKTKEGLVQEFSLNRSEVEKKLFLAYITIRSIATLPSTIVLDSRTFKYVEKQEKVIDQIYRNIVSEINVSEIYVVSKNFVPKSVGHNKHIIEFAHYLHKENKEEEESREDEKFEHLEIYKQIQHFQRKYPTADSVSGIAYPAYISNKLITCDTRLSESKHLSSSELKRRMGVVYSVPFYNENGEYMGVVAAILREDVIKNIFTSPFYVLSKPKFNFYIENEHIESELGQQVSSLRLGKPSKSFPFSYSEKVKVYDESEWFLSTALPKRIWESNSELKEAKLTNLSLRIGGFFLALLVMANIFIATRADEVSKLNRSLKEEVNRRTESEERLKQFTSDASHELRSPVGVIRGMTEVALKKKRDASEYIEILSDILVRTDGLQNIIQSLLELSRPNAEFSLQYKKINMKILVDEVITTANDSEKRKDIAIQNLISPGVLVFGDEEKLFKLVLNLVTNAIKYSKESGGIVRITNLEDSKNNYLEVRDNGIGISKEELERIFDRFYRADKSRTTMVSGVGLGLSICQKIAAAHKGEVTVTSKIDEGSVFTFRLPKIEVG
ncbi:MAG: HAMP domain-containing histidine kinase [Bacteriovoracaceae bacterium]|nr:HAMP domain-containing histidine kinase [Bacteriovoracaceae bacterium]